MARWNILLAAISFSVGLLVSCAETGNNGPGWKPPQAGAASIASEKEKKEVVDLLKQALKDSKAADRRMSALTNHLWGWARTPQGVYRQYPVAYAKERLIVRGSDVVPVLLDIIRDPKLTKVHWCALDILAELDTPLYLTELNKVGQEGRVTAEDMRWALGRLLPYGLSIGYNREATVMDWLNTQLAQKSFDEIILGVLDEYFTVKGQDGGLSAITYDMYALRWLNRTWDGDFDVWLSIKSPSVAEFRRSQLLKGYDPATALRPLRVNIDDGMLDEAMVAIYSDPKDRKACKELLEIVHSDERPDALPSIRKPPPGGAIKLKDWYWNQRPYLKYDRTLHRFVSKEE